VSTQHCIAGTWKKLNPDCAGEIRLRAQAGVPKAALAREYKVSASTVRYHTLHGKASIDPYAAALERAADARRRGDLREAARELRLAASLLETCACAEVAA
jgi:transposase-like protein